MAPEEQQTILEYLRTQRFAVVSSVSASGAPQSALVGVAVTDALEIIFDTVSTSRKRANLVANPSAAVNFAGPAEQTLQYEGRAHRVDLDSERDRLLRETYYRAWPEGRTRRAWPNIAYWRIIPTWIRYSDHGGGPRIVEVVMPSLGAAPQSAAN